MLEAEYQFYKENEERFLNLYENKFIIIHNNDVHSAYETLPDAYNEAIKMYQIGTFLIHQCVPAEEQVQFAGSRVIFS